MQLFDFVNEVNNITIALSKENLMQFINNMAFKTNKAKRDDFINHLKDSKSNVINKEFLLTNFLNEYAEILKKLESIEDESRCVDSQYEYYETRSYNYYDDDDGDILLSDDENVIKDINETILFINKCIDYKEYEKGYELVKILSELKICTTGDYSDYYEDSLDLCRLNEFQMLYNYDLFKKQALYLAYFGNSINNKVKEIYYIINKFYDERYFSLLNINQINNEKLNDFDKFLSLFLKFLLNKEKNRYVDDTNLINNTLELINSEDVIFETIATNFNNYPKLLKNVLSLDFKINDRKKLFDICLNCLYKFNEKGKIKSEIALLLANLAITLNKNDVLDNLYYIAFINDVNINNYLRLKYHSKLYNKDNVKIILDEFGNDNSTYEIINLFEENENIEYSLYNLEIIYLLLKNLNNKTNVYQKVLNDYIRHINFNKDDLINGTTIKTNDNDDDLFIYYFKKMNKETFFEKSKMEETLYTMKNMIIKRANEILEEKDNKSYEYCAYILAILGELFEENGNERYKNNLLLSYRNEYWRRKTFVKEINNFIDNNNLSKNSHFCYN